jgi:hypothetical protein
MLPTHGGNIPDLWGRPLAPDFVSFWTGAWITQATFSGTALLILLSVDRCQPGAPAEGAALAAAACLATLFLFD